MSKTSKAKKKQPSVVINSRLESPNFDHRVYQVSPNAINNLGIGILGITSRAVNTLSLLKTQFIDNSNNCVDEDMTYYIFDSVNLMLQDISSLIQSFESTLKDCGETAVQDVLNQAKQMLSMACGCIALLCDRYANETSNLNNKYIVGAIDLVCLAISNIGDFTRDINASAKEGL